MNNPPHGVRPTQQELMEFVDGTLSPSRYRDVERSIAESRVLQNEVKLLTAMRRSVQNDVLDLPSKKFTAAVMSEILPHQREALWMRLVKNSSNLFAMVLVLSMIGIVFVSGPGKVQHDSNIVTNTIASYGSAYDAAKQTITGWTAQFIQPANRVVSTPSGKFLLIGLVIFFIAVIADEVLEKRFFHARIKH